jgi:hypothetical protein
VLTDSSSTRRKHVASAWEATLQASVASSIVFPIPHVPSHFFVRPAPRAFFRPDQRGLIASVRSDETRGSKVMRNWLEAIPVKVRAMSQECGLRGRDAFAPHQQIDGSLLTGGVKQLIEAIQTFITQHNENLKPFRWTKSADDILASIEPEHAN